MQRYIFVILSMFVFGIVSTSEQRINLDEAVQQSVQADGVTLDLFFETLPQGRVGLVRVRGDNITAVSGDVFVRPLEFFQMPNRANAWFAFVMAGQQQSIRRYSLPISVEVTEQDEPVLFEAGFNVVDGGFIQQNVTLPFDEEKLRLLDREIEDIELEEIIGISTVVTDAPLWDARGFMHPIASDLTSPFGAVREFNDGYASEHTGWDYEAGTGMPLYATASGIVAFADALPIRGNHVMINHGRGIYSGYSHLSVVFVTEGQTVQAGQVVGLVGTTGRSTSAHVHFEMLFDGRWIDSTSFLQMPTP